MSSWRWRRLPVPLLSWRRHQRCIGSRSECTRQANLPCKSCAPGRCDSRHGTGLLDIAVQFRFVLVPQCRRKGGQMCSCRLLSPQMAIRTLCDFDKRGRLTLWGVFLPTDCCYTAGKRRRRRGPEHRNLDLGSERLHTNLETAPCSSYRTSSCSPWHSEAASPPTGRAGTL